MQTDHANLTRFEYLPLERIDAKHYRWHAEIVQGGSLLLYRPGTGAYTVCLTLSVVIPLRVML